MALTAQLLSTGHGALHVYASLRSFVADTRVWCSTPYILHVFLFTIITFLFAYDQSLPVFSLFLFWFYFLLFHTYSSPYLYICLFPFISYQSAWLSLCLSFSLMYVYLCNSESVTQSACQSVPVCACLPVRPSVCLSACLPICVSVCLSVRQSVCQSIYLLIFMTISLFTYWDY